MRDVILIARPAMLRILPADEWQIYKCRGKLSQLKNCSITPLLHCSIAPSFHWRQADFGQKLLESGDGMQILERGVNRGIDRFLGVPLIAGFQVL